MTEKNIKSDLSPYRFLNMTVLQLMALLALIGIAGNILLHYLF